MATVYTIWSRKEQKQVPDPETKFKSSADAQQFLRRIVQSTGDAKDRQNQTFDIESHTV